MTISLQELRIAMTTKIENGIANMQIAGCFSPALSG
jgi:hypothetical protein